MKKRTQKLDDEREIDLGMELNGRPGFIKAGSLRTTEAEKEEASANILKAKLQSNIDAQIELIYQNAKKFARHILAKIAPQGFWDAMERIETDGGDTEDKLTVSSYIDDMGISVIQDGLRTIVKANNRVIAEMDATIDDPMIATYVEADIKRIQSSLEKDD